MRATLDDRLRGLLRLASLAPSSFPRVGAALEELAKEAQAEWVAWASGEKRLPNGERIVARTGEYARSIKTRRADGAGELAAEVYTDSPVHEYLSDGTRERDLKVLLQRSQRVRRAKAGHRYLVIAFRHDREKPGDVAGFSPSGQARVPERIVRLFRNAERGTSRASRVVAQYREASGQVGGGPPVSRRRHEFGMRHHGDKVGVDPVTRQPVYFGQRSHQTSRGRYTWKSGLFSGMVHFTGFRGQHGMWLTFRVMSERSPAASWISPGIKPMRILEQVEKFVEGLRFADRVGAAAREDVEALIEGG